MKKAQPTRSPAADEEERPEFAKVHGVENLYFRRSRGVYVTRVSLNGTRSWKSLETDKISIAKLRHRKQQEDNEKARQGGAKINGAFRTLGELAKELEERMNAAGLAESSVIGYRGHVKRLRENWQRGAFDEYPVRNVTLDVIFELRDHLTKDATVRHGRVGVCTTVTKGYCNTVVNDTLFCLRRLIRIAMEKRVLISDPFTDGGVLRKKVNLPVSPKKPALPARAAMDGIFRELRTIAKTYAAPGWIKQQQALADANADFAEFLAYSGARHEEANLVLVKHYKPGTDGTVGTLHVPGFKSVSSERTIPVIPPLKRILDRLVAGRSPDEKLLKASTCLRALHRVCGRLKVERLTQHHLRHYFATLCIEKGVDVPTVSRWLGHNDGGRLALQTYGHLRHEHSLAQAALVDFGDDDAKPVDPTPAKPGIVLPFNGDPAPASQAKTS